MLFNICRRTRLRQYSKIKKEYLDLIDIADQISYKNNCDIKFNIQIQNTEDPFDIDLLDIIEILN